MIRFVVIKLLWVDCVLPCICNICTSVTTQNSLICADMLTFQVRVLPYKDTFYPYTLTVDSIQSYGCTGGLDLSCSQLIIGKLSSCVVVNMQMGLVSP